MTKITNRTEYLKLFSGKQTTEVKRIKALEHALEIRKFEIELYWKRAAYFWTFIAAAFAGYFLLSKPTLSVKFEIRYLIGCLGFVFSIGWYLVNRGSKAWQKNWEAHVDLLEDEVIGPLYKTTINRDKYELKNPVDAFPFSVSKINQLLSLFVVYIWGFLMLHSLGAFKFSEFSHWSAFIVLSSITGRTIWLLINRGQTTRSDEEIVVDLDTRKYAE
jgi:hypothetical protein